jgi:hypothetical protein
VQPSEHFAKRLTCACEPCPSPCVTPLSSSHRRILSCSLDDSCSIDLMIWSKLWVTLRILSPAVVIRRLFTLRKVHYRVYSRPIERLASATSASQKLGAVFHSSLLNHGSPLVETLGYEALCAGQMVEQKALVGRPTHRYG